MTDKISTEQYTAQQAEWDRQWARKIPTLGPDGRLAKAREDLAHYADFPATELLDLYEQAREARDAQERVAGEDPESPFRQAQFLQQKAQVEVLRGFVVARMER